jgi:hypothetical protein
VGVSGEFFTMPSVSFNPVGSWAVVAGFAVVVTALTVWAYTVRLRGTTGAWRWFALGLRVAAIVLCVIAALRPSVVFQEKKTLPTSWVFLLDDSSSMKMTDEVGGQSRYARAVEELAKAREAAKTLGEGLSVKFYRFDSALSDDTPGDKAEPKGRETALGKAMLDAADEAQREGGGARRAELFVLSDGKSNAGIYPMDAAVKLKAQQVKVNTVPFGSPDAGPESRDIAVQSLDTAPTVHVKNQLQVKGALRVRGFAGKTLDVELRVEGQTGPVATKQVKVPDGAELIQVAGLTYIPQSSGEKQVTLRVEPRDGELTAANNEVSTFVKVIKGGLNVLFVQGPHSRWEQKFVMRAITSSPDLHADLVLAQEASSRGEGVVSDADFAPQKYDVYILGDLPAESLTPVQQAALAKAVERGAGLIMLGGRSSFGPGGWARTPVANVLPLEMSPQDGQIEPEGGVKFVPNFTGVNNVIALVGAGRAESVRIWENLPPLTGINHLGKLKLNAEVFGTTPGPNPEPVMVGAEAGAGRALAFGGETWVWARLSDESRLAHRKLWRQVIFWLAHKEDTGENEVNIKLDTRRIAVGQKLDFGLSAKDPKGAPIPDVHYEVKVEREAEGPAAARFAGRGELFNKGNEWRGFFTDAKAPPGTYRATVIGYKGSGTKQAVGSDSSRFMIFQDDRELENPAADRLLLKQVADATRGVSLPPERLAAHIRGQKGNVFTETFSLTERKVWDNWPFLVLFATLLTVEWWVRKRHGWV